MTKHFSPREEFFGEVAIHFTGGLIFNVLPQVGNPNSDAVFGQDRWRSHFAVEVADIAARDAYYGMYEAVTGGATQEEPCIVWRADGTATGLLEMTCDGVTWIPQGYTSGTIEMTMSDVAPPGWALAQGQVLTNAKTQYPALWAAVGSSWKSGNNIVLPDMRGRLPVGQGKATPNGTSRIMGQTGGAETVKLSPNETPLKKHKHTGSDWTGFIRSTIQSAFFSWRREVGTDISGTGISYMANTHPSSNLFTKNIELPAPSGGAPDLETSEAEDTSNVAHENMPPFVVVNYKIKL